MCRVATIPKAERASREVNLCWKVIQKNKKQFISNTLPQHMYIQLGRELNNRLTKVFKFWVFLKQFLSEDSVPRVLIALNYQFTSNESNSACWNGLHLVFPSNFTNKNFRFLEQSGWFYKYAFSPMSWWYPESLAANGLNTSQKEWNN